MGLISPTIGFITGDVNGHITGCAARTARSFYRPMLKDVLDRVERRLEATGVSATAASKAAGLSEDAIRNMRRAVEKDARQGVSTATIFALAPVLGTTPSWLLEGRGTEEATVPIIGRVGADADGTVIYTTGQQSGDRAPVPPGGSVDSVALEVIGHSMRGIADDGALLYFDTQKLPPTPDMLGYPAIVETDDGRVLLKRLLKGSRAGLYDLESVNAPTLEDVRIVWAAEITAIIPPRQARRVILRSGTIG